MMNEFERIKCTCKSKMFELYTDGTYTKIICRKCKRVVATINRENTV